MRVDLAGDVGGYLSNDYKNIVTTVYWARWSGSANHQISKIPSTGYRYYRLSTREMDFSVGAIGVRGSSYYES